MASAGNEEAAVHDNPERARFELPLGEYGVAFINYRDRATPAGTTRVRLLTHAEVPPALRGSGVGARLCRGTLELLRERGERMVPQCPFIVAFVRRHPQYRDLLPD